jgi:hypothetical protein
MNSLPTVHSVFAPWQRDGALVGLDIDETVDGDCWTGSSAVSGRADAWRCSYTSAEGSFIVDPCFANPWNPTQADLVCVDAPDATHATRLVLTQPLDYMLASSEDLYADPWSIELASGERCTFVTGATAAVAGRRLNYYCSNGSDLYGSPDRTKQTWMIMRGEDGSSEQAAVPIAHAWS